MATRGTLGSAKFTALYASLKNAAEFILQPCDGLADAIQNDDATMMQALCGRYLGAMGPFGSQEGQIDTLVLGCTHYPFALQHLQPLAGPDVQILETGQPVARQARRLLQGACLDRKGGAGRVALHTTGELLLLRAAAQRWLSLGP